MTVEEKIDEIETRLKTESHIMGVWDNHLAYHNKCTEYVTVEGLWLEFGVFRGRSICQFAERTSNDVYGFDSFEGLPEHWNSDNPKGYFNLNGIIPDGAIDGLANQSPADPGPTMNKKAWPANVKLIKGWFDATLPTFLGDHSGNCALIHIDSDLYSSCRTVLTLLKDRIVDGTLILFDEINDYENYRDHEIKAFAEYLLENEVGYEPLIYQNLGCSQGCFRIKK